ncbi:MAG: type II toxin-antitoxin system VapC family toxin [Deltaproteobacteria bacterium]|nr:type II toxin-antitoxin system VapC family toxin [Deltaproteobacteria bacterium]MBW2071471.1 type II toxin-antitoxin system VapC family toxin [Deltaproteobacteria bacterium]
MIAYFDTSSIVKWFFDEPYCQLARDVKSNAKTVVTSLIAFPEFLSAVNRATRDDRCLKTDMESIRQEFLRIWPDFQWITVNEGLVKRSAELIFLHDLRSFDAIHLASALVLKEESAAMEVFFSCFDRNLNRAALEHGFMIHRFD